MTKSKTWQLTPSHTLTLAPPNKQGECSECHSDKDIRLISETSLEIRNFCWSCSRDKLLKFELGDYPVENKSQMVKELRAALHSSPEEPEKLEIDWPNKPNGGYHLSSKNVLYFASSKVKKSKGPLFPDGELKSDNGLYERASLGSQSVKLPN